MTTNSAPSPKPSAPVTTTPTRPCAPCPDANATEESPARSHGAQGRVGMVVTGLLGFGLAALFVVTESLPAVAVAHSPANALEFVVNAR
mgnify:CR=1 FL=1